MIKQFNDIPSNAVGFKASGKVTKKDYEEVIFPAISDLLKRTGKINFLLQINTELKNFSAGAWFDDLKLGLQNFTKWNRIAIVSNIDLVNYFSDAFTLIVPGKSRGFKKDELDYAKLWIAEEEPSVVTDYRKEILAGLIAGMRATSAPAFTSAFCNRGAKSLHSRLFKFLESPVTAKIVGANLALEFIGDKLPMTPDRTSPGGVIARAVAGGFSGAALSAKRNKQTMTGALFGVIAAVGSTYLCYYLRKRLAKRSGVADPLIGFAEDLVVLYLGRKILKD